MTDADRTSGPAPTDVAPTDTPGTTVAATEPTESVVMTFSLLPGGDDTPSSLQEMADAATARASYRYFLNARFRPGSLGDCNAGAAAVVLAERHGFAPDVCECVDGVWEACWVTDAYRRLLSVQESVMNDPGLLRQFARSERLPPRVAQAAPAALPAALPAIPEGGAR